MQRRFFSHNLLPQRLIPTDLHVRATRVRAFSLWPSKRPVLAPSEPAALAAGAAEEGLLQDATSGSGHALLVPVPASDAVAMSVEPAISSGETLAQPIIMTFQMPVSEMASVGLGAWTPVGAIQNLAEFIHAGVGLPWWASVVGLTALLKLSLFGLSVKQTRLAAAIHNHRPEIDKLTASFNRSKLAGDLQGSRAAHLVYRRYVDEHQCSPTRMFVYSLLPAPLYVCSFLALRDMASAGLPSLVDGGLFWFANLAAADPYYILPVVSATGIVLNYHASRWTNGAQGNGFTAFIYAMAAASIPFTATLPSLTLVYFATLNFLNAAQSFLWRFGWLRQLFRVPERIVRPFDRSRPGFMDSMRETYKALQEQRAQPTSEILRAKSLSNGPVEVVGRAPRRP